MSCHVSRPQSSADEIVMHQALAIVQTSVTLAAVHDGIGETADSLTSGRGEKALKV